MSTKKNQKKKSDNMLNLLIAVCTVLVIGVAVLIAFSANKDTDVADDTTSAMMLQIEKLDIKEDTVATLEMADGGVIKMELYPKIAPNTVCNFIELANSGFYDGLIFHRCIENFMIQGGDPEGTGAGGPGYMIAGEFSANGFENNLSHERGILSMARRSSPLDSAGSQFFITVADATFLDTQYAAFGKVTSGMEVADKIVAVEKNGEKPVVDQVIKSIRVDTKGIEYPEAEKIK